MTTDLSEKALERRIMRRMPSVDGLTYDGSQVALDPTDALAATKAVGSGWFAGNPRDYDRTHALDVPQRFCFLHANEPDTFQKLGIVWYQDGKDIHRQKFLAQLSGEIGKRGVIDVPLQGLPQDPFNLDLRHGTASPGHGRSPVGWTQQQNEAMPFFFRAALPERGGGRGCMGGGERGRSGGSGVIVFRRGVRTLRP